LGLTAFIRGCSSVTIAQRELSGYQDAITVLPIDQISMGAESVVITLESKQTTQKPKGEMLMQGEVSL